MEGEGQGDDEANYPVPIVVKQEVETDYILPDQEDMFNDESDEEQADMEPKEAAAANRKRKSGGGSSRRAARQGSKKVLEEEPEPVPEPRVGEGLQKRNPRSVKRSYRESSPPLPIKVEEVEEEVYNDSGGDSDYPSGEESKRARKRKPSRKKAKSGEKKKKEDEGKGSQKQQRQRKKPAPEDKLKRNTELAAKRAKMTPEELKEYRSKAASRGRARCARMTSEAREADLRRKAEQMRAKRAAMTPEQLDEFRKMQRERAAARRAQLRAEREEKESSLLNPEERERLEKEKLERRMKSNMAHKAYVAKLTEEDKAKKRRARLLRIYAKRMEETPEEKEARRQKEQIKYLVQRVNMTPEELEEFRTTRRELQRQNKCRRAPYSQWSEEKKERLKAYQRDRKYKDTPEQREARLEMYKRNAAKQKEKKILLAEGYTKEEAMDILKMTRPELFPPPAPLGRPHGVAPRREPAPYTPVADGRGNKKGRPLPVPEEELQEYLADKEKWEKNFDLKWKNQTNQPTIAKSKNGLPLTLGDIRNSCGSTESENRARSDINSSADQKLAVVQSIAPRFESQPASSSNNLPSTSSSAFVATQQAVADIKVLSEDVEPNYVTEIGTEYDFPSHMSDGGFSPQCSAPPSPVPGMNFHEDMPMSVTEIKQEFVSTPMKVPTFETFDEGDDEINEPTSRTKTKLKRKLEFCCELCGKIYKTKRYYTAHMFESHGDQESNPKLFTCPAEGCSMTFNNSTSLIIHYRVHSEVKVHKNTKRAPKSYGTYGNIVPACSKCNITFDKLCLLQKHASEVHSADHRSIRLTSYACEHCGKSFKQKCTLDDHVKRIHMGMSDNCDLCGRSFQSAVKLWRHKVDSHGMKDLDPSTVGNVQVQLCMFCGEYIFRNMKSHIQKQHPEHLEEYIKANKPSSSTEFHCDLCDKTILQYSRESHIRSKHPEELLEDGQDNRVACDICQRKFWTEKNLATHVLHFHFKNIEFQVEATVKDNGEVEPLTCQFCSLEQEDRTMYKLHVIDQHSEELLSLVKKKVEEGTVLSKQQLALMRNRHWRKNHPEAGRLRYQKRTKPKSKDKETARVEKNKEKSIPTAKRSRPTRSRKAANSKPSSTLPKVLITNCGRKSTKNSLSADDKKILERFPDIAWGHPVVVVKLLSDTETQVFLTKVSKQDVENNLKSETT